jgi:DNA-binding transcriptional MocR family regulator
MERQWRPWNPYGMNRTWASSLHERSSPEGSFATRPQAFHLWLKLPTPWNRAAFAAQVRSHGVIVVASDAFPVGATPPEAVPVCLGGATGIEEVKNTLEVPTDVLEQSPTIVSPNHRLAI